MLVILVGIQACPSYIDNGYFLHGADYSSSSLIFKRVEEYHLPVLEKI